MWSLALAINGSTGEATAADLIDHTAELGGSSQIGNISSFGVDADGELYLVSHSRGVICGWSAPRRHQGISGSFAERELQLQLPAKPLTTVAISPVQPIHMNRKPCSKCGRRELGSWKLIGILEAFESDATRIARYTDPQMFSCRRAPSTARKRVKRSGRPVVCSRA